MSAENSKKQKKIEEISNVFFLDEERGEKVNYTELLYRFVGKWKLILLVGILTAAVFGAVTKFLIAPKYEATSTLYILSRTESDLSMNELSIGSALTKDYIKVFDSWEIHQEVIDTLGLPYTYSELSKHLDVTNENDTRMLDITVKTTSPTLSADIANAYAMVSSRFIAETMAIDEPSIVSVAIAPEKSSTFSYIFMAAVGFVFGLIIAGIIIVIDYYTDDKYKTAEDIKKFTGLVNLASVPMDNTKLPKRRTAKKG